MSKSTLTRRLLRPLRRRRFAAAPQRELERALAVIDDAIAALASLRPLAAAFKERHKRGAIGSADADAANREWLQLTVALLRSRRISWAQYVFTVGFIAERVNEERWFRGDYDKQLPASGEDTDQEYEAILDDKLLDAFNELGIPDVTALWRDNRSEYDLLRERGRRFYFHGDEYEAALRDVVDESYTAAQAAAAAGAFRAAVTLLGASLEGQLLLRCLRSPRRARTVANSLPRRLRNRAAGDIKRWAFEVLVEVCDRAGWLRAIDSESQRYLPGGLAHSLREMRNWIHPAREAADRPWQGVYHMDFQLAQSLYSVVMVSLRGSKGVGTKR